MSDDNDVNEDEDNTPGEGHNSGKSQEEILLECIAEDIAITKARRKLNKRASANRDRIASIGHDKEAFKDEINYFKKQRHDRDGYDESCETIRKVMSTEEASGQFAMLFQEDEE